MTAQDIIVADTRRQAQIEKLTEHYREDTPSTPFWALLFGALYFARWGFWGRAFIVIAASLVIPFSGLVLAPFIARGGWKDRAKKQAERAVALS